ncbi:MAG: DNA recombination protein RmuC [Rickettsiales bacterium]|jgi:DNA recombination protein RmuC
MIIFATICAFYSIAISLLVFYVCRKLKEALVDKSFKDSEILELSKEKSSLLKSEEISKRSNQELKMEIANLENLKERLSEKTSLLFNEKTKIESEKNSLEQRIEDQKTFIAESQKNLKVEFENIAAKHLKENSDEFMKNSSLKLTDILKPYTDGIAELKTKVETTYDKESKDRFSLGKQVENLLAETNKISAEANNLASALKGQSKKQGNWGEMILETILQNSGLMKGYQYTKEENIKDEDGKNQRPDFIVKLPNERVVIIDSKTSLVAYDKYNSAENSAHQELYLKEHLSSMKKHIDSLSGKKYDDLKESLDFTLMFIPIEPAYLTAIQSDPALWNYAYEKKILLISPTNLIACLKLIDDLWRREEQSKNQVEILKQVGNLHDKFVGFLEAMSNIGKKINGAQEAYGDAIKKLNDGSGNLINRVENIKKLGIKTTKNIAKNKNISDEILSDSFQDKEPTEDEESQLLKNE